MEAHDKITQVEYPGQFDPEFCGRVTRIAAICFVLIVLLEAILFLTVQPDQCPGWQIPTKNGSMSVWGFWALSAFWTLNIAYNAIRWRRASRKILDQIEWARKVYVPGTNPNMFTNRAQFKAMCTLKNNLNMIIAAVCLGSVLFVCIPLLAAIDCM